MAVRQFNNYVSSEGKIRRDDKSTEKVMFIKLWKSLIHCQIFQRFKMMKLVMCTTSVVVLAGELLREAEKLVNAKIHPMTIVAGYHMAAECARNALLEKVVDNKLDAGKHKSGIHSNHKEAWRLVEGFILRRGPSYVG